jgi:hypothetical protein
MIYAPLPEESTGGGTKMFALVVISGYEVEDPAHYLGQMRGRIWTTWKTLDYATVEILIAAMP